MRRGKRRNGKGNSIRKGWGGGKGVRVEEGGENHFRVNLIGMRWGEKGEGLKGERGKPVLESI